MKVGYAITIGGWSVDSDDDPRTELLQVETRRSIDAPDDRCRLTLYAPPPTQPGLLEQLAGAALGAALGAMGLDGRERAPSSGPSVTVRGVVVKEGDHIEVELRSGESSATVMTAEVHGFESSLERTTVLGRTALHSLATSRLNVVYQNQSTGQVVRDLAGQAGVSTGEVQTGATWPYLVVDESRSVLRHLRSLARREAADMYVDAQNRLVLKRFTKTGPDHTFHYGIDLLDLSLRRDGAAVEQRRVDGESPVSTRGLKSWPWLVKDLASLGGAAGGGTKLRTSRDGAIRTKDAAGQAAAALLGAANDASTTGTAVLLGNPRVELGHAVEVKGAPWPELNGLFKVTSVSHRVRKRAGYVTTVGLSGHGGAAAATDLLGALAGALTEAVGL